MSMPEISLVTIPSVCYIEDGLLVRTDGGYHINHFEKGMHTS